MTRDDVAQAKAAVEARGQPLSGAAVWREVKNRGIPASHTTVRKFLRELALVGADSVISPASPHHDTKEKDIMITGAADSVISPAPSEMVAPVLPPEMPLESPSAPDTDRDGGTTSAKADPEVDVQVQRQAMFEATLALLVGWQGVLVDGVRYGQLHPEDPERQLLKDLAQQAMGDYHEAWLDLQASSKHRTQLESQQHRLQQEAHVARTQPDKPQAVVYWGEKARTATNDHARAHAKNNLGLALAAWEEAVQAAPWSGNGTPGAAASLPLSPARTWWQTWYQQYGGQGSAAWLEFQAHLRMAHAQPADLDTDTLEVEWTQFRSLRERRQEAG